MGLSNSLSTAQSRGFRFEHNMIFFYIFQVRATKHLWLPSSLGSLIKINQLTIVSLIKGESDIFLKNIYKWYNQVARINYSMNLGQCFTIELMGKRTSNLHLIVIKRCK